MAEPIMTDPARMRLGFAGIGLMGSRMARRLLDAGYSVTLWNRHPERCAPLQEHGATIAHSLADLVRQVEVVMLCVSDTAAVQEVVWGPAGVASAAQPGQILVDFSSIEPSATRRMAQDLRTQTGMHWVDAPVSGGVMGAETGQLVIMAGGDAQLITRLQPCLAPLAQRVSHMGPVGSGQVTKVCNQLIVAANAVLIAEAVALAEQAGVDVRLLAPALAGGFADSKPLQILAPRMATQQHQPVQWRVQTLAKDLRNAAQLAAECHLELPLAHQASAQLALHEAHGHAQDDLSTVIQLYPAAAARSHEPSVG